MVTSPNDTVVTGIGGSVTDASGNVWAIDKNGQIIVDGKVDYSTANVDELAYYYGVVWQKNANNQWYSKASPSAAWVYWPNAAAPAVIPGVSANDATIEAGGTSTLVDANGNVWGLTKASGTEGYQVTVDGAIDQTTANVIQMAIVNGTIWQENTAGLWYSKTTPASTWSSATTIDPLTGSAEPISLRWVGGGNNLASNPADWSPAVAPKAGDTLTMGSGTIDVSGNALAGDTLSISPGATVDIDTSKATTLKLATTEPSSHININVAEGSTLTLTAVIGASELNVSGGTLSFVGTSVFAAFTTVLSDNIVGTGTVDLDGGNAAGETMEINGSTGNGLRFDISAPGPGDAGLVVEHPSEFHGTVVLQSGYVELLGLHATSGELLNGVLEMFNGSKLVDTTRFVSEPNTAAGEPLQMQQTSVGVALSIGLGDNYQPGGVGKVLPLHT
jgi:hypothetical protein